MVTLTFKLVRARNQSCLPCEFGANPFSGSQDISYTNKNKNSSGDEIANVNFFYNIAHVEASAYAH